MSRGMVAQAKDYLRKFSKHASDYTGKDLLNTTDESAVVFCQYTAHHRIPDTFYLFVTEGDDKVFRKEFGMSQDVLDGKPFRCLIPDGPYQDLISARQNGSYARIYLAGPRPKPMT